VAPATLLDVAGAVPLATVAKLLQAARSGTFQAVQSMVTDLIADGWLVRPRHLVVYCSGAWRSWLHVLAACPDKRRCREQQPPVPLTHTEAWFETCGINSLGSGSVGAARGAGEGDESDTA